MFNKIQISCSHFTGVIGYIKALLDHVDTKCLKVNFKIIDDPERETFFYSVSGKQYLNKKEV